MIPYETSCKMGGVVDAERRAHFKGRPAATRKTSDANPAPFAGAEKWPEAKQRQVLAELKVELARIERAKRAGRN